MYGVLESSCDIHSWGVNIHECMARLSTEKGSYTSVYFCARTLLFMRCARVGVIQRLIIRTHSCVRLHVCSGYVDGWMGVGVGVGERRMN